MKGILLIQNRLRVAMLGSAFYFQNECVLFKRAWVRSDCFDFTMKEIQLFIFS